VGEEKKETECLAIQIGFLESGIWRGTSYVSPGGSDILAQ
jgi:hypothetical protein